MEKRCHSRMMLGQFWLSMRTSVVAVTKPTDPFATAKPDARLIKLLIRARRFNATLLDSDGVPFAALA